jgi:hypothetical protein
MTQTPAEPQGEAAPGISPAMRALGLVMLVLAVAGVAVHLVLLVLRVELIEGIREYFHSKAMHAVLVLAFLNLFTCYFHYRRTGMRLDFITRILSNVWIVLVLLLEYLNISAR